MSSRDYERLGVVEFGRRTIESGDLDPIYNALVSLDLGSTVLNRWLLAYWCLYDAGSACYLAGCEDAGAFWTYLQSAAMNHESLPSPIGGRWKRGHERRHWRGQNAIKSWLALEKRYGSRPEDMAAYCAHGEIQGQEVLATQTTFKAVSKRAQEHFAFGPWIGFKIADMVERVMGVSVSFEEAEVFMFDSPREAALLFSHELLTDPTHADDVRIRASVSYLKDAFKDLKAPPTGDRPIGLQEIETVLCKWKSHRNGHYPLNNDVREIRAGLAPWARESSLARRFLDAMPKETA